MLYKMEKNILKCKQNVIQPLRSFIITTTSSKSLLKKSFTTEEKYICSLIFKPYRTCVNTATTNTVDTFI